MKHEEINKQSKNEVKDLLNEYVVEPLIAGTGRTVGEIKTDVNEELENVKSEIKANTKSVVEGRIIELKKDLSETEEQIVEEINAHLRDITDELIRNSTNEIKKEIASATIKDVLLEKTGTLQSEITEKCEILNESIKFSEKFASDNFTKLEKQIITLLTTEDTGFKNTQQLITNRMQLLNDMVGDTSTTTEERFNKLTESLKVDYNSTLDKLEEVNRKMASAFENTTEVLAKYNDNTIEGMEKYRLEIMECTEKRYKVLMGVSLSFGVVNFFGVVAGILLHFMF